MNCILLVFSVCSHFPTPEFQSSPFSALLLPWKTNPCRLLALCILLDLVNETNQKKTGALEGKNSFICSFSLPAYLVLSWRWLLPSWPQCLLDSCLFHGLRSHVGSCTTYLSSLPGPGVLMPSCCGQALHFTIPCVLPQTRIFQLWQCWYFEQENSLLSRSLPDCCRMFSSIPGLNP